MGSVSLILLSLCLGLANAARGSGVKNTKPVVIVMMLFSAYTVGLNLWYLFPVPLLASWWVPGGTGRYMPWVIRKLSFLGLGNNTWRFFEFASVFIYSLLIL